MSSAPGAVKKRPPRRLPTVKRTMLHFRKVVEEMTTSADMEKIWARVIRMAKGGNQFAIDKFLLYTLGKPGEIPEDGSSKEEDMEKLRKQVQDFVLIPEVADGLSKFAVRRAMELAKPVEARSPAFTGGPLPEAVSAAIPACTFDEDGNPVEPDADSPFEMYDDDALGDEDDTTFDGSEDSLPEDEEQF